MSVSLPPQLEERIAQKVRDGHYNSAFEVIQAAMQLLERRDAMEEQRVHALRQEVAEGFRQIEHGDSLKLDDDSMEAYVRGVKERGRQRLAEHRRAEGGV